MMEANVCDVLLYHIWTCPYFIGTTFQIPRLVNALRLLDV